MVDPPGLVSLLVVDFLDPLFAGVGAIDCLCVVIRDICDLTGLCNGILVFMNKFDQLTSLLIGHLDVLAYHIVLK